MCVLVGCGIYWRGFLPASRTISSTPSIFNEKSILSLIHWRLKSEIRIGNPSVCIIHSHLLVFSSQILSFSLQSMFDLHQSVVHLHQFVCASRWCPSYPDIAAMTSVVTLFVFCVYWMHTIIQIINPYDSYELWIHIIHTHCQSVWIIRILNPYFC